jgi:UDP-GlcNAc3NAcA epimerase
MKKKICITLGTRPEIIRLASIINKIRLDKELDVRVVYTGQHYDYLMNQVFFKELNIAPPDVDLKIGSGTHGEQTSKIMIAIEKYLQKNRPDMVVVFGDTNSSLAVSIVAVKMKIPLTHIEAGGREWEMDIPEEVNRRMIDHIANLLIACSDTFVKNLKSEKVMGKIYNCGDPLYDTFKIYSKKKPTKSLKDFNLTKKNFIFLTLHRDKNVDNLDTLTGIMKALIATKLPVVFPVHPRTKKQLVQLKINKEELKNIFFLEPFDYQNTIHFMKKARLVITDSGGLQKEAFWCHTPCITLRDHTSWVETITLGGNFMTKVNERAITRRINYIFKNEKRITERIKKAKNPYAKKDITGNIIKLIKKHSNLSWVRE